MKGLTQFWYKVVIVDVMYAFVILHNMIVEHEGGRITVWGVDELDLAPTWRPRPTFEDYRRATMSF